MSLLCGNCGARLEAGDTFCVSCGARQSGTTEPQAVRASTPVSQARTAPGLPRSTVRRAYPLLPIARTVLRVMAVFYVVGGVVELIVIIAASSAAPAGFGGGGILAGLGVLGGFFILVVSLSGAVMAWAMADLIDIALRLEETLPG